MILWIYLQSNSSESCGLLVECVIGSRSEGRGFNPRPMLYGSGVKAMPG